MEYIEQVKRFTSVWAVFILRTLLITACCSGGSEPVDDLAEVDEHIEVPLGYEELTNPITVDHEVAETGAEICETSCVVCHRAKGMVDGLRQQDLIHSQLI